MKEFCGFQPRHVRQIEEPQNILTLTLSHHQLGFFSQLTINTFTTSRLDTC